MSAPVSDRRRKRLRAEGFDYSAHGLYYVTICVDRKEERFGAVHEGRVLLNEAGQMASTLWTQLPQRFPAIELDLHIVMPNHLHGIVFIDHSRSGNPPSLPMVIQAFKSLSAIAYGRGVKEGRYPPYGRSLWQRGYHDRILRDDQMLERAQAYIDGNPGRWEGNRVPGSGRGPRR